MRIERGPDFENDKIRAWKFGAEDREAEEIGRDPTRLSLDVEREEFFESRAYRFQPGPEALRLLVDQIASFRPGRRGELDGDEVVQTAAEVMEETSFKFLAKRRKEDGFVSFLLVVVTGGTRSLLARQEWCEETDYRQAVQEFETGFLPQGLLAPPLVVTVEEWRRYYQEGHFRR